MEKNNQLENKQQFWAPRMRDGFTKEDLLFVEQQAPPSLLNHPHKGALFEVMKDPNITKYIIAHPAVQQMIQSTTGENSGVGGGSGGVGGGGDGISKHTSALLQSLTDLSETRTPPVPIHAPTPPSLDTPTVSPSSTAIYMPIVTSPSPSPSPSSSFKTPFLSMHNTPTTTTTAPSFLNGTHTHSSSYSNVVVEDDSNDEIDGGGGSGSGSGSVGVGGGGGGGCGGGGGGGVGVRSFGSSWKSGSSNIFEYEVDDSEEEEEQQQEQEDNHHRNRHRSGGESKSRRERFGEVDPFLMNNSNMSSGQNCPHCGSSPRIFRRSTIPKHQASISIGAAGSPPITEGITLFILGFAAIVITVNFVRCNYGYKPAIELFHNALDWFLKR